MKNVYGSWAFFDHLIVKAAKEVRFSDSDSSHYAAIKAPSTISSNYTLTLPADDGAANQVLQTDGSGVLSWATILTTSLASGSIYVGVSGTATAVDTAAQGDIEASATGLNIKSGVIVNNDINASAAISLSKLAALTASRALISNGSGVIDVSSVTSTELGYLSGVTSGIQTQINNITSLINNFEWQESAIDRSTTPPGSPSTGDRYLVIATATGAWAGQENKVAEYNGSGWDFVTPTTGTFISIDDESDGLYLYDGAAWNKKYFEATTASTGLVKVGFDIRLDSSSAGDGLGFSSGVLSVNVDNSTVEINSDTVRVKDAGITNAKIATGVDAAKIADGSVSNTEFQYLGNVTSDIQTQLDSKMRRVTADWANADGASKAVTHNLNTKDIVVAVYDKNDDSEIEVDSIVRTSVNVVTVTASQAPVSPSGWRIVILG